jgi:hypothetical protein
MRWAASDSSTLISPFFMYYVTGAVYYFSLLLGSINRTLEEYGSLSLL